MSDPRTRAYGEIIAGSRYPHVVEFFESDGTTPRDVSSVYDSYRAAIKRNGSAEETELEVFAVDDSRANVGVITFSLTAAQTRALQGQITSGLLEVQAVAHGATDPDTLFLLDVSIIGDAAA